MRTIIICLAVAAVAVVAGCSDSDSPTPVSPGNGDDTSPPAPVADAVLTFSEETGTAHIDWTAPHDDSPGERVAGYEIRYTYTRGYPPPDFWDLSTPVADPPEPLEPGERQRYTFSDLRRARDLYVGIRSIDEAGNRSSAADPATVYVPGYRFTGRCLDVFTRAPLEGLAVTLATGPTYPYTTDANGEFVHQKDLDGGVMNVEVLTGGSDKLYHPLSQAFVLENDSVHTFVMIPLELVQAPWAANLLTLLKHFVNTISPAASHSGQTSPPRPAILAKWHHRPVPCYIPPFVNDKGLDYEIEAKRAAQRWMDRTGEPLFAFVDAPPDTGIILTYEISHGGIGVTIHTRGEDGHPIRDEIQVTESVADVAILYIIFLHEFGHTISLGHVSDDNFIMYAGQPLPDDISDDEVRVVQLHEGLPTRIDLSIYDEDFP